MYRISKLRKVERYFPKDKWNRTFGKLSVGKQLPGEPQRVNLLGV